MIKRLGEPAFQLICYSKFGTPTKCGLYWTKKAAEESAERHIDYDVYFSYEIFEV